MILTKENKPFFIILALAGLILSLLVVVGVGFPNFQTALASPYGGFSGVAGNPTFAPASNTNSTNSGGNGSSIPTDSASGFAAAPTLPPPATPVTTAAPNGPTTAGVPPVSSGACPPITIVEMDASNRQAFDTANGAVMDANSYAFKMNLQVDFALGADSTNFSVQVDGMIDGFDEPSMSDMILNLDMVVILPAVLSEQPIPPIEMTIRMVDNAYYFHAPLLDTQLSPNGQELWVVATQEDLFSNVLPYLPFSLDTSSLGDSFSFFAVPEILDVFAIERFVHTEFVGPDGDRTHYRSQVDLCEFLKSPEFRTMAQLVATMGGLPAPDVSDFQSSSTAAMPTLSLVIDHYMRAGALSNLNLDFRTVVAMDQPLDVKARIQAELSQLNATFSVDKPTNTIPFADVMAAVPAPAQ